MSLLKKQSQFGNGAFDVYLLQRDTYGNMLRFYVRKNKANSSATEGTEDKEKVSKSLVISWLMLLSISVVSVTSVANKN